MEIGAVAAQQISELGVDAVMNAGVVQHDHGRAAVACSEQAIDEVHDAGAFDGARMSGMDQRIHTEIQCAEHAASTVMVRLDLVRQTSW
ncbi:hypothetical protein WJ36_23715 [Burkholderia ubonensis]|nr:hypothetical protein WJ36_23715 [Burkholderia ubonensis]